MAYKPGKRKQLAVAHGAAVDWVARNPASKAALANLDYVDMRIRKTGGQLTGKEKTWSRQHGKYRPDIEMTSRQRAALAKGKGPLRLPKPRYTAPEMPEGEPDLSVLGGLGHAIRDVPEIISGAAQIGKGIAQDAKLGRGLPGAAAWAVTHAPGPLGFLPDTPGPWDYKKLPKEEQESFLNQFGRSFVKDIPEQAALLADPMAWYQDPLIQLSTAAGLVLPFFRVGSVGKLSTSFRAANPGMTASQAAKAAVVESWRPGFMAAHGVEGGIKPRVIKGKYAQAPGRMQSRGPVPRGLQRGVDIVSERLDERAPGMRGSSSSRAAARNRRMASQAEARRKAANLAHEETVAHAIAPGRRNKARRAAGLATSIDPSTAAALIASLEGPVGASVREAVELKVGAMRSVLDQNVPLREISDGIEDLKRQRDEALEADPDFDATPVNNKIAEQQAQLDFKLGKTVPPVTGSPIRDAVLTNMRKTIGKNKAAETIKVWDAVARGANPKNPGQWYLENIAEVKRMPQEQFVPQGDVLYQRMVSGQGGWYFPMEIALEELVARGDQPVQFGKLIKQLEKAGVPRQEFINSELFGDVAEHANQMWKPSELLDEMDRHNYFDVFDPDVEIRSGFTDPHDPDATRWDPEGWPQVNSRTAEPGEYFEMVVTYPDLMGTRSGYSHWERTGNVYHVRFQRYVDENDNVVMLIDEIQSDWASDYRKAKKEGTHQRTPEETAAEKAELEERVTAASEALDEAQTVQREVIAEIQRHADEGTDPSTVPGLFDQLSAASESVLGANSRRELALSDLQGFDRFASSRVPPSPMGANRYADNAVRQILRWADSEGVDRVVLVDGDTQALRNSAAELGVDDGVRIVDGYDSGEYGEWADADTGETLSNEAITQKLRAKGESGSFTRLYNKEFPDTFKKVAGAEGRHADDAYIGHHSGQPDVYDYGSYRGYVQTVDTGMPGTVFEMTDAVKAKIRQDQPLYRRDFEGVPQGATEFLADGRARLSLFQTADVSTWIHELAHVAVRDLDPGDIAILERELADGRSYGDWTIGDQEKLARSFETYMRDGYAAPALREVFSKISKWMRDLWRKTGDEAEQISPQTADVFDRMLGRRHQNTVVLDDAEIAQVRTLVKELEEALDSGDLTHLDDAATAFAKLSDDAEAAGVQILMRNARSPEHAAAILEGLRERKNIVVEDYRRRGLIEHEEDARGYFPQMSMWEALGQPQVEASRLAAMGDVVGTPRVTSKALNKNRNKLVRYQTGEVLNDPTAVMYILRARLRVLETIRARDELYAVGDEIRAGETLPDQDKFTFIRNPDKAPTKIDTATEAAATLSRGDFTRIQARRLAEDTDEINGAEAIQGELAWTKGDGPRPSWVTEEPNVRYVPKRVAQKRLGEVFSSGPTKGPLAVLGALGGMLNAGARAALIYAPLFGARYVTRNWIQNAVLMAVTQPTAFAKLMSNRQFRKNHPQLWDRMNEEFGTIQAQALPEFNVRAQGKLQRTERDINRISGQVGEHLGRFADVPLRAASLRRHMEGYGFTTPEQITELLDAEAGTPLARVRDDIAQRTREDMIDFDALTPWEKEVLSRYLFIWPFIRGSAKWPFMFAREYPGRFAVAAMGSKAAFSEDDRSPEEMLKIGGYDMSWLDPTNPAREKVQALHETLVRGAKGQLTLKPLLTEALAPQYQEVIEMMAGGRGGSWGDLGTRIGGSFVPGLSTEEAVRTGKLQEFALKTFGKQTRPRSVIQKADKWMGELDSVVKEMEEQGGYTMPPQMKAGVEKMRAAYGDWMEASSRAKWSNQTEGIDSVDATERAGLALEVMHEHYPEKYRQATEAAKGGGWDSMEEVIASGSADNEKVYRTIYDQMFGMKEDFLRDAKKAGWGE